MRQLSALVNFVSCLRANRARARVKAFMRWRLNLEAARAAAAERLSTRLLARAAAASACGQRLASVVIASTVLKSWRRAAFRRWRRPSRRRVSRDGSPPRVPAIRYAPTSPVTPPGDGHRALVAWSPAPSTPMRDPPSTPLRDCALDRGYNRIASPVESSAEATAAARVAQVGQKMRRLFDAYADSEGFGDDGLMNQYSFGLMAVRRQCPGTTAR